MPTRLTQGWGVSAITLVAALLIVVGLTHALLRWWVRGDRSCRTYSRADRMT